MPLDQMLIIGVGRTPQTTEHASEVRRPATRPARPADSCARNSLPKQCRAARAAYEGIGLACMHMVPRRIPSTPSWPQQSTEHERPHRCAKERAPVVRAHTRACRAVRSRRRRCPRDSAVEPGLWAGAAQDWLGQGRQGVHTDGVCPAAAAQHAGRAQATSHELRRAAACSVRWRRRARGAELQRLLLARGASTQRVHLRAIVATAAPVDLPWATGRPRRCEDGHRSRSVAAPVRPPMRRCPCARPGQARPRLRPRRPESQRRAGAGGGLDDRRR